MIAEINRINQVLPDTNKWDRAAKIRQWVVSVIDKLDGYKVEHYRYVKEGETLLEHELALRREEQTRKRDVLHVVLL